MTFQKDERAGNKFYPLMNLENNPQQEYSLNLFKTIQMSQKYLTKLKIGTEIRKEDIERDIDSLGINEHYGIWMRNLKIFFNTTFIPDILKDHNENLNSLNRLFKTSINIQIVNEVVGELSDINKEEIETLIYDNNLKFSEEDGIKTFIKGQQFSNNIENYIPSNENDMKYQKIFFGDTNSIKFILNCIEFKLRNNKILREKSKFQLKEDLTKSLFTKPKKENIPSSHELRMNFTNSMLNKKKYDRMADFSESLKRNSEKNENSLLLLKNLLEFRLDFNKQITPMFIKPNNSLHEQLIL